MATYYVATNGSNSGNGSSNSPFGSINQAMKANLKPGDTVIVRSGTYKEAVVINKDGNANNYITIRSEKPGGAKIDPPGDKHGVHINANYVTLEGFDISGSQNSGITGMQGPPRRGDQQRRPRQRQQRHLPRAVRLPADRGQRRPRQLPPKDASSGIHLKGAYNVSGSNSDNGYRIIIRDNVAYDNITKYGAKTDGSGISLDDFQNTQLKSLPSYKFKTLVEGNIVYSNFGRGIQVAWSDNATIRDNISMHNNKDSRSVAAASSTTWARTTTSGPVTSPSPTAGTRRSPMSRSMVQVRIKNVSWSGNTTFNGRPGDDSAYANANNSSPSASNGNKLGKDPGLSLSKVQALAKELDQLPRYRQGCGADRRRVGRYRGREGGCLGSGRSHRRYQRPRQARGRRR